jgi:hypothetical protein
MVVSIPQLQSAVHFFMNITFVCCLH